MILIEMLGSKRERLNWHAHITISCKNHVCYGTSGKYHPANELTYQIEAALLICDGHYNPNGNKENSTDTKSEEEPIPWQIYGETVVISKIKQGLQENLLLH